jgi:hypothetical protein
VFKSLAIVMLLAAACPAANALFEVKEEFNLLDSDHYIYEATTGTDMSLRIELPEQFESLQTIGANDSPELSDFTANLLSHQPLYLLLNGTGTARTYQYPNLAGSLIEFYQVQVLYWFEEESRPGEFMEDYGVILRGFGSGIPEPASLSLALLCAPVLIYRRGRS